MMGHGRTSFNMRGPRSFGALGSGAFAAFRAPRRGGSYILILGLIGLFVIAY